MHPWVLMLALLLGVNGCSFFCGVDIAVVNEGLTPITDLTISYTGGRELIRQLWPGESVEVSVNPTGESDLKINFADATGHSRGRTLDVYLAPDFHGRIDIRLDGAGKVSSHHEITSCLSPN